MNRRLFPTALAAVLLFAAGAPAGEGGFNFTFNLSDPSGALRSSQGLAAVIEILVLMTVLTLAPAILITMTSFVRIVVVFSFIRRALSVQELPPNQVVLGFALFLTVVIMAPVGAQIHTDAWVPWSEGKLALADAGRVAGRTLGQFLLKQTREEDIALIVGLTKAPRPQTPKDLPFHVVVPAFILSELRTAFTMGFMVFLPFLVIDMVVSSILLSMGMFMLPPVLISTPFKILLFVLVDGWHLVTRSLVASFA
jgi:flagellar biosynthetic protein FliP